MSNSPFLNSIRMDMRQKVMHLKLKKPTYIGLNVLFYFIRSVIRRQWVVRRFGSFYRI